jgi:glycerophosphoryl diester phosphodiesterase
MSAALAIPACDGLEFDVRSSADAIPVLLHDTTLVRVQHLDAAVRDLTAAELAAHGIPTLEAVLAAVSADAFLDVELKGEPIAGVVEVLERERGPQLERAVVSSFEAGTLRWLHEQRPSWPLWLNALSLSPLVLGAAREIGCAGVSAEWTSIDAAGMARARREGLEVAAWTLRDLDAYHRLEALGVRAICVEAAALDG